MDGRQGVVIGLVSEPEGSFRFALGAESELPARGGSCAVVGPAICIDETPVVAVGCCGVSCCSSAMSCAPCSAESPGVKAESSATLDSETWHSGKAESESAPSRCSAPQHTSTLADSVATLPRICICVSSAFLISGVICGLNVQSPNTQNTFDAEGHYTACAVRLLTA